MQLFPSNAKVGCSSASESICNLGDNLSLLFTQFSACTALECNISMVPKQKGFLPAPLSLSSVLKLHEMPLLKGVGACTRVADIAPPEVCQNIKCTSREMETRACAGLQYPQIRPHEDSPQLLCFLSARYLPSFCSPLSSCVSHLMLLVVLFP